MKSVCVIDDDQIYQMIAGKIIEKTGIFDRVMFYGSCIPALEAFKDPDVVLPTLIMLDINMPYLDGWQFLDTLIAYRPNLAQETSLYIVSSSIAAADIKKAASYKEVKGFISKPLTVSRLKEVGESL